MDVHSNVIHLRWQQQKCSTLPQHGLQCAQKIHFTDTSNVWFTHFNGDANNPGNRPYTYKYVGDTSINSIEYKMISCITEYASYQNMFASIRYCVIREDTLLKKVFVLMNDTEQVLMDYNLAMGDTVLHVNSQHDTSKYFVSGIDSTIINSVYHKVWRFDNIFTHPVTSWAPYYYIIEGVGCSNGPLFIIWPLYFEGVENLNCFYNNGFCPLVSPSVQELTIQGWLTFDNQTSCILGINTTTQTNTRIVISPNPTTISLDVITTNKITTLVITNLLGQTVYAHEYNSQQVHVNVADLPKGIYFVKVNGGEVRKFVKE